MNCTDMDRLIRDLSQRTNAELSSMFAHFEGCTRCQAVALAAGKIGRANPKKYARSIANGIRIGRKFNKARATDPEIQ